MIQKSLFIFLIVSLVASCAKQASVVVLPGQKIPNTNITMELAYDSALDKLIPGYKIITVGVTNQGYNPLTLNPAEDEWVIIDNHGRPHRATQSLREEDANTWIRLDAELRQKLSSPLIVSGGVAETFDLFVPDTVALDNFQSLVFTSSDLKMRIKVITGVKGF